MSAVCAFCGGRFDGVGPSHDYGHDGTMCALDTHKKSKARIEELESALRVATARLIEQVLVEVHETQIAPRDKRIAYLEDVCRSLGSPERVINRK